MMVKVGSGSALLFCVLLVNFPCYALSLYTPAAFVVQPLENVGNTIFSAPQRRRSEVSQMSMFIKQTGKSLEEPKHWSINKFRCNIRRGCRKSSALSMSFIDPSVMKSSITAVTELLVCCGFGAIATKKGILDKDAISALTKVVYNIFLPALLLANVASTVAQEASAGLFAIPLLANAQMLSGLLLARVMLKVLRIDKNSQAGRHIQINTGFGNSGVLPILFVSTLFRVHPDPTILRRSIAYISLFLMGWSPIFWTLGFSILTGGKEKESKTEVEQEDSRAEISELTREEIVGLDQKQERAFQSVSLSSNREMLAGGQQESSPLTTASSAVSLLPPSQGSVEQPESMFKKENPEADLKGNLWHRLMSKAPSSLKRVFSPPIIGAFMGLIIGLCPPLQNLLIKQHSPLLPVYNALQTFAKSYSPTALLVLAGSLALETESKGKQEGPSLFTQVAAVSAARFVFFPLMWSGIMWVLVKKLGVGFEPIVTFLVLLESCMPSAQNSVLMLNLTGDRDGATRMARLLFAIYMVASLPISLWLTLFMQQLKI